MKKYKIKIESTDPEINRTLSFERIIIDAENKKEALEKAYANVSFQLYIAEE